MSRPIAGLLWGCIQWRMADSCERLPIPPAHMTALLSREFVLAGWFVGFVFETVAVLPNPAARLLLLLIEMELLLGVGRMQSSTFSWLPEGCECKEEFCKAKVFEERREQAELIVFRLVELLRAFPELFPLLRMLWIPEVSATGVPFGNISKILLFSILLTTLVKFIGNAASK